MPANVQTMAYYGDVPWQRFTDVSGGAKAVEKRRFENPFSLCRVSAKEGTGSGGW